MTLERSGGDEFKEDADSKNKDDEILAITINLIDIAYFKGSTTNDTLTQCKKLFWKVLLKINE